ncbi:cation:proton antiporter subunit C [Candidatus Aerophobetes bacterium]|nr:cation:proton antiporter subunit C [Candidatus Aerophobetes bacterium]
MMAFYLIISLFLLGIWGIVSKDNLIKKIISLNIFNSSLVVLFIYIGSRTGSTAPIMEKNIKNVVDPLPQALMLTSIVISICIMALALSLAMKVYKKHGTLSISRIENKLNKDE